MLILLNSVFAIVVLLSAVHVINQMSPKTPFSVRFSYIVMGTGSLSTLLSPLLTVDSNPPTVASFLITMAIAVTILWDRRCSIFHRTSARKV